MRYEVIVTPAAEADYAEIVRYLGDVLHSRQAVMSFIERLAEVLQNLQENPGMYALSRDAALQARGYHTFSVKKYVALYLIDEEHKKVWIARIFHGSQNYERYL